jgi:uncharacterized protein YkwD
MLGSRAGVGDTGGVRRVLATVIVALALIASVPSPVHATTADWRARMLTRVNVVRAQVGVHPVRPCPALMRSAQAYADALAGGAVFSHTGPDGSMPWERMSRQGYAWRTAGENISYGQDTVYEAMQAWRGSDPHAATLTNPQYKDVGFGFARDAGGRPYWVQDFGSGGRCRG